jgi:hypothetical protein
MTPYQLTLYAEVYNEQKKKEIEFQKQLTYLGALWTSRLVWQKRPQSYEQLTKQKNDKEKMTPEEILAEVMKINAELGGTTY